MNNSKATLIARHRTLTLNGAIKTSNANYNHYHIWKGEAGACKLPLCHCYCADLTWKILTLTNYGAMKNDRKSTQLSLRSRISSLFPRKNDERLESQFAIFPFEKSHSPWRCRWVSEGKKGKKDYEKEKALNNWWLITRVLKNEAIFHHHGNWKTFLFSSRAFEAN